MLKLYFSFHHLFPPFFSFLPIGKHVSMEDKNLHYYIIILFHKPLKKSQKKCHVWVFKQLSNHNSIFTYVCMSAIMPWSQCKLVFYFFLKCWTFSNKPDRNIAQITRTVKHAWITLLQVHLCFLKPIQYRFNKTSRCTAWIVSK